MALLNIFIFSLLLHITTSTNDGNCQYFGDFRCSDRERQSARNSPDARLVVSWEPDNSCRISRTNLPPTPNDGEITAELRGYHGGVKETSKFSQTRRRGADRHRSTDRCYGGRTGWQFIGKDWSSGTAFVYHLTSRDWECVQVFQVFRLVALMPNIYVIVDYNSSRTLSRCPGVPNIDPCFCRCGIKANCLKRGHLYYLCGHSV